MQHQWSLKATMKSDRSKQEDNFTRVNFFSGMFASSSNAQFIHRRLMIRYSIEGIFPATHHCRVRVGWSWGGFLDRSGFWLGVSQPEQFIYPPRLFFSRRETSIGSNCGVTVCHRPIVVPVLSFVTALLFVTALSFITVLSFVTAIYVFVMISVSLVQVMMIRNLFTTKDTHAMKVST